MAAFLGSAFLVFVGFFVATFINFQVKPGLGSLLDPVGINFIASDLSHLWTTTEKNLRLLELEGTLLKNRLLSFGVGLAALGITYVSFRFAHRTPSSWWSRILRRRDVYSSVPAIIAVTAGVRISIPQVPRAVGFRLHVRQTLAIAWTSFRISRAFESLFIQISVSNEKFPASATLSALRYFSLSLVSDDAVSAGGSFNI